MKRPISLPLEEWPDVDRQLWLKAAAPVAFGKRARIVSQWSPDTRKMVVSAYGRWLSWLHHNDRLIDGVFPGARVTSESVEPYIDALRARLAPASVIIMVQGLLYMLTAIDPGYDGTSLKTILFNLRTLSKPVRDKRGHLVEAATLYNLGISLMSEAENMRSKYHAAIKARDGLAIAILISCVPRIRNLSRIEIGKHLQVQDGVYCLDFPMGSTKNGNAFESELPPALTPWIELYIKKHRNNLAARGADTATRHLWVSRNGGPMASGDLRDRINMRTTHAFGKSVWPHLFRSIASTSMVDHAPDLIGIVPDLLGHRDERTAQRYYILASGKTAHDAVGELMTSRRQAARKRLKGK